MKKLIAISVFWMSSLSIFAQDNLVRNPSFEKGDFIKRKIYKIKQGDRLLYNWEAPRKYSPYLLHSPQKSVAVAKTGYTSVGLSLGYGRKKKEKFEYITGELKEPLQKGKVYCVCFNVLLHRASKWASKDVGLFLSHDEKVLKEVKEPNKLTASLYANGGEAVTNTKWRRYCGYYMATGGEAFISFGKFGTSHPVKMKDLGFDTYSELDFQNEAFYQFDDISVKLKTDETDCGCAEPPIVEEEDSVEVKAVHAPYLFALDASGSMKKDGLFDSLRMNLARFVKDLPDGTPVSFVTFASTARKIYAGVTKDGTAMLVDSLLSRAPVGGGTNAFLGLQLAYESWPATSPDSARMVFVSDGEFQVSPKITSIIKNEYETKGRKLTLLQIGARASGLEQLKPYMDDYIYTIPSELSQAVSQINKVKGGTGESAVACECEEEFSDTMNYHFVVDFSGSMKDEKMRAIMALRYLFEKVPETAMISVTTFNTQARELYMGKKTDITMGELTRLLSGNAAWGGTDPAPGVKHGLKLAEQTSEGRYSHLILVTDYSARRLSQILEIGRSIKSHMSRYDLDACSIEVDQGGLVSTRSQFDKTTASYVPVGRVKFENDLFNMSRSSCDYTSQPYHYNPSKAAAKSATKKVAAGIFTGLLRSTISN